MRLFMVLVCLLISMPLSAVDPLPFESLEQEKRFQLLAAELRCLQCQNQNLADSDAVLARDMRNKVFELMQGGKSDPEIKTFMVERYGEFVLYKPSFSIGNMALWLVPLAFLLAGLYYVTRLFGHAKSEPSANPSPSQEKTQAEDW